MLFRNKSFWSNKKKNILNKREESNTSKKDSYDILPKLLSVTAAIVLWFYVIGVDSPIHEKSFYDIPVTLNELDSSSGFSIISGYSNTVDITLSGKKSDLNKIKESDISAHVDLSGITHSGEYPMNLSVKVPNNVSVINTNPSVIYVYVDKTITRSVPVQVDYIGGTTDKTLVIDSLIPASNSVTVTGPEEEILKIKYGKVTVNIGLISSSIEVRERVILVDSNGDEVTNPYIKLSTSEMKIDIPVYKYSTVPIELKFKGIINPENIESSVEPSTVTIKGSAEALENIQKVSTEIIDETKISGEGSYYVKMSLPSGVSVVSGSDTVYAAVKLKNNASREVLVDKIFTQGTPVGYKVTLKTVSLNVTLRGAPEDLLNYSTGNIYALVDISSVTDTGTLKLPADIKISNSSGVYVSGDYYIEVESVKIKN